MFSRFLEVRQAAVNGLLSLLYGQPMQVMPKGHVGLAGAVVFWYVQDGNRQLIMVRNTAGGDGKARFLSCLGVGSKAKDIPAALRAAVKAQLGEVFARTVSGPALDADRVGAAPLFSYTDEGVGVALPVQSLVWVVHVAQPLVDLIVTPQGMQAVMVPEFATGSNKVSPTHKALFESVQRHLPKMKRDSVTHEAVDEGIREVGAGGGRVVH